MAEAVNEPRPEPVVPEPGAVEVLPAEVVVSPRADFIILDIVVHLWCPPGFPS